MLQCLGRKGEALGVVGIRGFWRGLWGAQGFGAAIELAFGGVGFWAVLPSSVLRLRAGS